MTHGNDKAWLKRLSSHEFFILILTIKVSYKSPLIFSVLLTYIYLNLDPDRDYNSFTTKHIPPIERSREN